MRGDCIRCADRGWVCENHPDKPWKISQDRMESCDCGAGMPCPDCNPMSGQPHIAADAAKDDECPAPPILPKR